MGGNKHKTKNRLPPFVPLLVGTIDAPAWRALSHGAKALYIALKRRYNFTNHNNGRIYLSQRDAAEELASHHNEIARWFRELQHYGFVVMTQPGSLGVEGKGKAPRWRLTELGHMGDPPTRDFTGWDGTPFKNIKTESRAGKSARTVPENRHTSVQESHTSKAKNVQEMARISTPEGVRENGHRTSLPSPTAQAPATALAEPAPLGARRKRVRLRLI